MLHKHNQCLVSLKGKGAISEEAKVFCCFSKASKSLHTGVKTIHLNTKTQFLQDKKNKKMQPNAYLYKAIKQ